MRRAPAPRRDFISATTKTTTAATATGRTRRRGTRCPGPKAGTCSPAATVMPMRRRLAAYAANAFGLHDTLGNVFEWVEDCWHDSYAGAPSDGSAWLSGDCSIRVQRGGAWGYPRDYLRIAVRGRQPQGYRYINAGMRVARTIKE